MLNQEIYTNRLKVAEEQRDRTLDELKSLKEEFKKETKQSKAFYDNAIKRNKNRLKIAEDKVKAIKKLIVTEIKEPIKAIDEKIEEEVKKLK